MEKTQDKFAVFAVKRGDLIWLAAYPTIEEAEECIADRETIEGEEFHFVVQVSAFFRSV